MINIDTSKIVAFGRRMVALLEQPDEILLKIITQCARTFVSAVKAIPQLREWLNDPSTAKYIYRKISSSLSNFKVPADFSTVGEAVNCANDLIEAIIPRHINLVIKEEKCAPTPAKEDGEKLCTCGKKLSECTQEKLMNFVVLSSQEISDGDSLDPNKPTIEVSSKIITIEVDSGTYREKPFKVLPFIHVQGVGPTITRLVIDPDETTYANPREYKRHAIELYNGSSISRFHLKVRRFFDAGICAKGKYFPNVQGHNSALDDCFLGFYQLPEDQETVAPDNVAIDMMGELAADIQVQGYLAQEPVVHHQVVRHQPKVKPRRDRKFKRIEKAQHKRLTKNLRR